MITLLTLFLTSFSIAFSGAIMPGPLLTITISETAKRGNSAGPLLIIGHSILELVLVIILLLGLAPMITNDMVVTVIGLAGGSIMLGMAVSMFRSLPSLTINWNTREQATGNLIVTGAVMSLANPYWTIWWATIGLGYILHSREAGLPGVLLFFVGHILADFVWYSIISVSVGKGRHLLNDTVYRVIIGICAVFLVFFAFFLGFGVVFKSF